MQAGPDSVGVPGVGGLLRGVWGLLLGVDGLLRGEERAVGLEGTIGGLDVSEVVPPDLLEGKLFGSVPEVGWKPASLKLDVQDACELEGEVGKLGAVCIYVAGWMEEMDLLEAGEEDWFLSFIEAAALETV